MPWGRRVARVLQVPGWVPVQMWVQVSVWVQVQVWVPEQEVSAADRWR
jgi:hypothetical protein